MLSAAYRRLASATVVLALLGLLAASPVLAISSITNTLSVSPTSFGDSQTVTMKSTTKYDQIWILPTLYWLRMSSENRTAMIA